MARAKNSGDALAALLALSGAVAVIAGAYGTHGASGKAAEWLSTGSLYQIVHAVAGLTILARSRGTAAFFLFGMTLFAGTLYAMAFGAPRWLGAVTPIGGLSLILGWMWLAVGYLRGK